MAKMFAKLALLGAALAGTAGAAQAQGWDRDYEDRDGRQEWRDDARYDRGYGRGYDRGYRGNYGYSDNVFDDPAVLRWGLARFDRNGDGYFQPREYRRAYAAFRSMADLNRNGEITRREYARVRSRLGGGW